MTDNENNKLYVKMFGNFSMTYNGASLLGKKVSETQFAYLMQILLYNRKNGVSRERLEETLFGDRDIKDVHHTMQSVIYNTKRKLHKLGLPEVNYIRQENGMFYWTDEIDVELDTDEFNELYNKAVNETDEDKKLVYLVEACHCYTGEFLNKYASVLWVAAEARVFREKFTRCVEATLAIFRNRNEYIRMERLGRYASAIAPFSDWEGITMEALVGMGRYKEAGELYEKTVDTYFRERGIRPSHHMLESLNKLSDQMSHPMESLDIIQDELVENNEEVKGGYLVSYPVFCGIYRMVTRMRERGGQSVYLMLCTIVDSKGNPMKEGEQLDNLSERLGEAICKSIRHGDTVNQYGRGQYLVLLVNTTLENCEIVQKRINDNFLVGRQRTGVQYYVSPVT